MRITPRALGTLWDEVTDELVARCVGLELATIRHLEDVVDANPRGYVSGPGCRPVEDGWTEQPMSVPDAETMDGCGRERGHLRMDWWQYCRPEGT